MENCALMESLILISNHFKDFAKEKAFLDELLSSVVAQWSSEEMKKCVLAFVSLLFRFILVKYSVWCLMNFFQRAV